VRKQNPWNTAFEVIIPSIAFPLLLISFFQTSLTPIQTLSLLSNFFNYETGPEGNRYLLPSGLHVNPRLTVASRLVLGQPAEISFPFPTLSNEETIYIAFLNGEEIIIAPLLERDNRFYVEIPKDLAGKGTVFVVVFRGGEDIRQARLDDESTVAGPALITFPFDSEGMPLMW